MTSKVVAMFPQELMRNAVGRLLEHQRGLITDYLVNNHGLPAERFRIRQALDAEDMKPINGLIYSPVLLLKESDEV